ncbi:hypothetical protein Hamer_G029703, partial [Homarus americanus]
MIVPLLHQWTKANALFKPPVINQCRTIELKLTKLWHKAVETSLGKGNLARKNEFLHTLDTLFDILTCKCSIQLCSESNCSHSGKRENNSHIDCGCPREKKIPVLELEFIKAQRTKAEGQGSMQMGSIDYSETKKQIANAKKREQIREREQKKKMKSEEAIQREEELCQDVYHFFDIPPINVNATKLSELVDLSLEVLEPPLTTSLTSQELRNLKETPMQVPKWPSHTQSVERCVKMVTEAAGHVYSHERREESPWAKEVQWSNLVSALSWEALKPVASATRKRAFCRKQCFDGRMGRNPDKMSSTTLGEYSQLREARRNSTHGPGRGREGGVPVPQDVGWRLPGPAAAAAVAPRTRKTEPPISPVARLGGLVHCRGGGGNVSSCDVWAAGAGLDGVMEELEGPSPRRCLGGSSGPGGGTFS